MTAGELKVRQNLEEPGISILLIEAGDSDDIPSLPRRQS